MSYLELSIIIGLSIISFISGFTYAYFTDNHNEAPIHYKLH